MLIWGLATRGDGGWDSDAEVRTYIPTNAYAHIYPQMHTCRYIWGLAGRKDTNLHVCARARCVCTCACMYMRSHTHMRIQMQKLVITTCITINTYPKTHTPTHTHTHLHTHTHTHTHTHSFSKTPCTTWPSTTHGKTSSEVGRPDHHGIIPPGHITARSTSLHMVKLTRLYTAMHRPTAHSRTQSGPRHTVRHYTTNTARSVPRKALCSVSHTLTAIRTEKTGVLSRLWNKNTQAVYLT